MANYYKINHARVIDGDTIDVNIDLGFGLVIDQRVCLYGLDAPEVFGVNASLNGQKAKEFVRSWLTEKLSGSGNLYYIPHDLEVPNDGYIAWVGVDGITERLNDVLISWGHATAFPVKE